MQNRFSAIDDEIECINLRIVQMPFPADNDIEHHESCLSFAETAAEDDVSVDSQGVSAASSTRVRGAVEPE